MFTVFGERLDVVQSPQILFTISSSKKRQTIMVYTLYCIMMNKTNDIYSHRNILLLVLLKMHHCYLVLPLNCRRIFMARQINRLHWG